MPPFVFDQVEDSGRPMLPMVESNMGDVSSERELVERSRLVVPLRKSVSAQASASDWLP